MTKLSAQVSGIFLAVFVFCQCCALPVIAQTSSPTSARKPVVVELFTSEGCSSCPPADTLLQKLAEQQPLPGADVIALEEHVDYWNHDGWTDPYSSADWTQRQLDYGSVFKTETYTPQMVVDGESQFVGSSARDASFAIETAARAPKTEVAITAEAPDGKDAQQFTVSVGKLAGNTPGDVAEVLLAVTEDGLRSSVSRGENAGHVLRHVATLRSLHKIGVASNNQGSASFRGDTRVKFDSRWNREKVSVAVFVQEKESRKILGAAAIRIAPTTTDSTVAAVPDK
ncbi:MAG: DUF1223 domain-containing protein [Candidatus Acidiferrales bacterium]